MKVKQCGNIMPTSTRDNPNQGRVYDTSGLSLSITDVSKGGGREPMIISSSPLNVMPDGTCRTIKSQCANSSIPNFENQSSFGASGVIVVMRGRNPDNPSNRTAGSPTEQRLEPNSQGICNTLTSVQKDNMVLESAVLTPKRTGYGKAIRKAYESGKIEESRHNMTELEARKDGISNTLTTVQKDNLLLEQSNMNVQLRIRKLTPLECWRLMSFSDEDFLSAKLGSRKAAKETLEKYPHLGKRAFTEVQRIEKMSNSQLYKQAGNSIVKYVLMAIFRQIL